MPANKKYLTTSPWQQAAKIITGLIGGYIIAALINMVLALIIPFHKEVLVTSIITHYILWGTLMILPYLFKNGFKALGLYVVIIIVLVVIYTYANTQNPFV
ncbi:hypothetical protein [Tenacibaculum amylolyticum]|uniref:hypothetical protein n=1 Tax=Tenacibaculum amylolyticum TaxID=104269 RepID=UPI003893AEDF